MPSRGAADDRFGHSVAVDGDNVMIGVIGDHDNGRFSGSVYVFTRNAGWVWSQQQKLTASDGGFRDIFGASIAMDGETAVIGAVEDDDNDQKSGSVYVFIRGEGGVWNEQAKLTASDSTAAFGRSVALHGETVMIGAIAYDNNTDTAGGVYVFTRSTEGVWSEQQKLTASDGAHGDAFGESVAVDRNTALIGAVRYDRSGYDSVYVFTRSAGGVWREQYKLTASDGAPEDLFGKAVALDGNIAVIGAEWDDDKGDYSGAAYIFAP